MSFSGARVLSFESRRAEEMAQLIRINGGEPFVAPALVEIPLEHNEEALAFAERLFDGGFDMTIFLTGVGARLLDRAVATRYPEEMFRQGLRAVAVVARGPKPAAVMREWNVPLAALAPEPSTWREVLAAIESLSAKRVAVQEYGRRSPELLDGLAAQGRQATSVPVYQWQFPPDTALLEEATRRLLAGEVDVTIFTTSVQLEHLLELASKQGHYAAVLEAVQRTYVASIGPTCSEMLLEHGITPALEPSHPKMGVLVREAALNFMARRGA